jgi:hypothetical protein
VYEIIVRTDGVEVLRMAVNSPLASILVNPTNPDLGRASVPIRGYDNQLTIHTTTEETRAVLYEHNAPKKTYVGPEHNVRILSFADYLQLNTNTAKITEMS